MPTISEALVIALHHHQAGRLQAAEHLYRQILAVEPNQVDAQHLLGVAAHQMGRHELAVECIGRAIQLNGTAAVFHNNLGEAYRALRALPEAAACYRRALELKPDFAEAHNNLGLVLQSEENRSEAVACFNRALELKPDYAEAHNNLGIVFHRQGKLDQAIASYRRAIGLKPDFADAHYNLSLALADRGMLAEAVICYRRTLALDPHHAEAYSNLGNVLSELGELGAAIASYRRALELKPDYAEAHNNLGVALKNRGKLDEAAACCRRALELQPDYAEAYNNLGIVLKEQGKLNEAVTCYRQAMQRNPAYAAAYYNLGIALQEQGELNEAIAGYRRALELKPDYAEAYNNLGNALKDQGLLDEAVACYRRAVELKPDYAEAHNNLIYALNFCPGYDDQALAAAYHRWNQQYAEPLARCIGPHANDRSPDRRLRVGYVSPDFRLHPIGRFLLPLLESHNHRDFEVFCYSFTNNPDAITERCRAGADVWRNVCGFSDEQLTNTIRQDRIDILMDLTMHMAKSRLLVFARKPAPVQVTYLAYCGTTGLRTMDYRLTDPYLDPPGQTERFYSEQSVRLPETYWCYVPIDHTPPVTALPAARTGYVTFGCLNNFCKLTTPTLIAWGQLLQATPRSRLLLHAQFGSHRDRVRETFAAQGLDPDRIDFVERVPLAEYFNLYARIDLALDPFQYAGGTTTCDALWMGVPVISLAGGTAVGRSGLSILSNIGLPELVAHNAQQYVNIAAHLAGNLPRLSELRATLRERMLDSPLMDAPRFTRHVEAAYRMMWQCWCSS